MDNIFNKKKSIAIVASDNGVGHIKRTILLCNKLSTLYKNCKFTLFANHLKIKKLTKEVQLNQSIKFKNFSPNIEKLLKLNNPYYKILKSLPNLQHYNLIISDNIPEVLLKNSNTILFANFLWSDLLGSQKKNYKKKIGELIKSFKPLLIQNYLFGMDLSYLNFKLIKKLDFFEFKITNPKKIQNSILLSVGNTIDQSIDVEKIILLLKSIPKKFNIYVEPRYYDDSFPSNFHKMEYTKKNISKMDNAIIRPGLGTIYSCFEFNIRIFVLKSKNKEMKHNRNIILKNKFGSDFNKKNLLKIQNKKNISFYKRIDLLNSQKRKNLRLLFDEQIKFS